MTEFADRTILITAALESLGPAQAGAFAERRPTRLLLLDLPERDGAAQASELAAAHGI